MYQRIYADVAQLAEQLICNQQVNGSSPFIGLVKECPKSLEVPFFVLGYKKKLDAIGCSCLLKCRSCPGT